MDTADNVTTKNFNNIESGISVDRSSARHEKRMSGTNNSDEYKPLNAFDTDDIDEIAEPSGRPRVNRKALLSFLAVSFVALIIIVLTVVFVVKNGMFDSSIIS